MTHQAGIKLTREFCDNASLRFSPKTETESKEIQERLTAMGYRWVCGHTEPAHLKDTIAQGLFLREKTISSQSKTGVTYQSASLSDFFEGGALPGTPQDHFNKLSARIDMLEEKLDRVLDFIERQRPIQPLKIKRPD